jgi:septum site-determining protein MinC
MKSVIKILSNRNNIVIKIDESATEKTILKELKEKLPKLSQFYEEEKTPILVTGKMIKSDTIDKIQKLIHEFINVKVEFDSPRTMGLNCIKKDFKKEIESSETKFFKSSLRSGQKIEFEGSIVILGDVNYGAEVVAEDNIVVLGVLRGMAHAGAKGNVDAIIAAHRIDSPQIRIASKIKERSNDEIENSAYTYAFVNEKEEIDFA